jgi:transcriptional repressor NrdR
MQLALRKRPVAADAIDAAVARIEYQLLATGEREVRSEARRTRDERVARPRYDRLCPFASVYRRFEDVSEFADVIEEFRRASLQASA